VSVASVKHTRGFSITAILLGVVVLACAFGYYNESSCLQTIGNLLGSSQDTPATP
jgi:hypothetical protein